MKAVQVILVIAALAVLFRLFYPRIEDFFVFFPDRDLTLLPGDLGLNAEEAAVETADGELLHGWFLPSRSGQGPVLLFFHGNAGNISDRLENARALVGSGFHVLLFDYRGYGRSTGRPSEEGIYLDAEAACDHLVEVRGIDPGRIVLFGRSLGGAAALEAALRRRAGCLIMESAFTSTKDMAKQMGPFALLRPLLPADYNNLEKIRRVSLPVLIVHGDRDEIVPFHMGEELFRAAPQPKSFFPVRGAGHNDTYVKGGEAYFRALASFAAEHIP